MNRKQAMSCMVVASLAFASTAMAYVMEIGLEERLLGSACGSSEDGDLLEGLRLPQGDNDLHALEAAAKQRGLLGCHQWLYPDREDFWFIRPHWNDVSGMEAVSYCLDIEYRLSRIPKGKGGNDHHPGAGMSPRSSIPEEKATHDALGGVSDRQAVLTCRVGESDSQ